MIQKVEQTHEAQVKMYMKLPKKKLVEMLIGCNIILNGKIHSTYSKECNCQSPIKISGDTNLIDNQPT